MDLYFAPLACSLSARIALYEGGRASRFHPGRHPGEDAGRRRAASFLTVNPLGPGAGAAPRRRRAPDRDPVVLQAIGDAYPGSGLVPPPGRGALSGPAMADTSVTSELHKFVFIALLDAQAPEGAKLYARGKKAVPRFDYLDAHLAGSDFLTGRFSVADAYLVTILNWAAPSGIDLARWPAVAAYFKRQHQRPSIAKAFAEELVLYREEQARQKAA
ncbi:MAG: glutathione S-transferase C-terminal domain-containing protein [Rhizomicrobium sp.]